ncbi:MAG: TolC family protein [Bacteroidota bacterium]
MPLIHLHILLKWATVWFLFCCSLLSIRAQDSLSLAQVIELARIHSLPAYRAEVDVRQAEWAYKSYRASLKPQLRLSGNIPNFTNSFSETIQPDGTIQFNRITYNNSYLSLQARQDIPATGTSIFVQSDLQRYDDFQTKFLSYNGVPVRIGILQPLSLYNPLKWAKRLAPLRLEEAEKQFVTDVEAISIEVLPFFFDLLLAQIDAQIAQVNQNSNQSLFQIAEERFELGKISENDLLQLQLELLQSEKGVRDAQKSVLAAQTALGSFLGKPELIPQLAIQSPGIQNLPPIQEQAAVKTAFQNRPESLSYQRRQLEAQQAVAEVKGQYGWRADLYASFGFARGSEVLNDIYLSPQSEQGVFMQVSIPLLDWGRGKAERRQAELDLAFVNRSVQQEQQAFEASVRQWVVHCNQMQDIMRLAKETQDIAQKRFDISKDRYLLGDISITELTLSLQAKDRARRSYMFALREYWQAWHQLRLLTLYDFEQDNNIHYDFN